MRLSPLEFWFALVRLASGFRNIRRNLHVPSGCLPWTDLERNQQDSADSSDSVTIDYKAVLSLEVGVCSKSSLSRLQLMPISLKGLNSNKSQPTAEKVGAHSMTKNLMALAFVFLCNAFCASQTCTYKLDEFHLTCETATCSSTITQRLPAPGKDTIKYSCQTVSCCGELKTTCTDDGSCPFALVRPEMQARIEAIAATSQVLVADCTGRYTPYAPAAESSIKLDRMLSTDRMLR